jgi:VWFA-related protein
MVQSSFSSRNFFTPRFLKQWLFLCLLGIVLCMSRASLTAQAISSQEQSAQSDAIPVFHVDTIRMQIPVLVLTPELKKVSSPIAANQFSISFNKVSPFHPRYARIEGDDPLHLAIVLDARSMGDDQLTKIDGTIAGLAPSFLHSKDRVSIYVMSCGEMKEVRDVPGDRIQLKNAVDVALSSWTARRQLRKAPPCSSNAPLWDDLAYVIHALTQQSGWRAILAVTDGKDVKSKHSSEDVAKLAQSAQVTILGLDPVRAGFGPRAVHLHSAGNEVTVTGLSAVCELSGGVRLSIYASSIAEQMRQFTQMLRDRYVLEFPIPNNAKPGYNVLHVDVEGMRAFIRPAGDGVGAAAGGPDSYSNQIPDASIAASQPPADQQPAPAQSAAAEPAVAPVPTPQQANTPEASASYTPPLLKVTSELTVEDVTVTDQHRIPVHGLQRSDFEVKEDGQPQTITNFEEYGTERPAEQAGTPQSTSNVFSNAQPQAPTTGAVNVLMLDDVATGLVDRLVGTPENLEVARKQSIKYLNKMPAGTQVAILQLNSTVRVLQGFTADKAVLFAAMKAASFKPAAGAYGETANRLRAPYDSRRDRQVLCDAANVQSELTVNGLKAVADYLSGIKGRKNLIWFTPGIPWLTNYSQFKSEGCLVDHTQELRRVYALLSAAQVALYPIDPRGMVADNSLSAVDSSIQVGGLRDAHQMGARVGQRENAFNAGTSEEHDSLRAMADATGGVPYFNRNDLDAAMQEAIETGADYYSLSYLPPLSGQVGKYHTIDIKVDRPGLRLLYRSGYNSVDAAAPEQPSADTSPEASIERELLAGMVHGQAPSTQLLFDVGVTPSTDPAKPGDPQVIGSLNPTVKHLHLVRYDLAFSLAPDQVSLLESPEGKRKGSVAFGLAAYDGEGKLLNSIQKTVKFTVSPREETQFLQRPLRVPTLKFDLPSGSIFVRFVVMDLVSQKMGTLEIPETVAK